MKKLFLHTLSALLLVGASTATLAADAQDGQAYQLRPADRLQVSVWREDALQREVRVLPDGSITMPLIGRLVVAGLGTEAVQEQMVERLKPYMPDPIVTVTVAGTDGNSVYVIGKVLKPGLVPLLTDNTTALQALSLVGGLDRFADGNAIRVLRSDGGKQVLLPVRYNDLIKGDSLQTNIQLQAGDTVLVP
ncbi:hypothetical protein GCM10022279_01640 [Comamonas faecalis]|uniref:Sugar ABC transporter substrate-binding protein n=1 Tax=Comamonas faecalis TaxID=1387849 RepID=A0ABP7QFL3_9BURK